MNEKLLQYLSKKPDLYEASTSKFWDDEHISKGMLEAHLNPEWEAATRKLNFVRQSVDFIADFAKDLRDPKLLDLGCGPGIYAELLAGKGVQVTGMDMSPRSIRYARESALRKELKINYINQNYLELDYDSEFDIITLIYCDFGVLDPTQRNILLNKIIRALKPGGIFIVDAWTPNLYKDREEKKEWSYHNGGFWCEEPYACLSTFYRYDECNTFADQYVIIRDERIECFNIWNHAFTLDEIRADFTTAGFTQVDFYGDVAGKPYLYQCDTVCALARKQHI